MNWNRVQRFTSQKKMKILTFSAWRQNSLNGVLDETTTANTRGRSSRAHARLCKFTSGSRPSSSRRPILRSVIHERPVTSEKRLGNIIGCFCSNIIFKFQFKFQWPLRWMECSFLPVYYENYIEVWGQIESRCRHIQPLTAQFLCRIYPIWPK